MKALIIEDESLIADEMKATITELAPDVEVQHVLPSLKAARKWFMQNAEPDFMFMDIKLSDGLSFELFSQFNLKCPVIFCTAYEEYAIRAFKVNGVDYLLKPVQEDDLRAAIEKVRQQVKNRSIGAIDLQQLVQHFMNPSSSVQFKERFIVTANNKWMPVEASDIAVFYKENISYLYTFQGEKLIYDFSSLEDIEEVLDPKLFFRANRQTIVHINAIQVVRPHGNQKLLVQLKPPLKLEVDISREKAPAFKKWVDR
jgi:DNA-binding LytR/AlgR family response regulator